MDRAKSLATLDKYCLVYISQRQHKSLSKATMMDKVRRRVPLSSTNEASQSVSYLLTSIYMKQNSLLHEEFRLVCPRVVIYLLYL